jgi:hypothetical protein
MKITFCRTDHNSNFMMAGKSDGAPAPSAQSALDNPQPAVYNVSFSGSIEQAA